MRERLASLQPQVVEIYDESGEHVGHEGAKDGGGHYQLLIVSERFRGHSRLARHRMVYGALVDMLGTSVHALAITAYTPEELNEAFPGE
ncbi:MAG TPA: BolA family protein [Burkholderiales bacterium]|nr:BolA family protein [Burkholderiales bacterium]